jgi:hypothetical protein
MENLFSGILVLVGPSVAAIAWFDWHWGMYWVLVFLSPSFAALAWLVWQSGALERPDRSQ